MAFNSHQPAKCQPFGDYPNLESHSLNVRKGIIPRVGTVSTPTRPAPKPGPSQPAHPQWLTIGLDYSPAPCPLVGSLFRRIHVLEALSASEWFVPVIRSRFRLLWLSSQPHLSTSHPAFLPPRNSLALEAMDGEVSQLPKAAAGEEAAHSFPGFCGRIFVVLNTSDGWRQVLDFSTLKIFLRNVSFHVEIVAFLQDAMHPGDWAVPIDLRDAYFYLLIHPYSQKWL